MTVDRHTHELARPFIVIATQNPVEYEGTYPLPEAQLDRFMVRVSLGYPSADEESRRCSPTTPSATACSTSSRWPTWARCSPRRRPPRRVHGSEALRRYVVAMLDAHPRRPAHGARREPARRADAVPRGEGAGRARRRATTRCPTTCRRSPASVLTHRLLLAPGAGADERAAVVRDALERVPAL